MSESPEMTAAARAVALNIPFILYAFPGRREMQFAASMPDPDIYSNEDPGSGNRIVITFFNNDSPYKIAITPSLNAADIMTLPTTAAKLPGADVTTLDLSTPPTAYLASVHEQIAILKKRHNAKTVLSRVIASATDRPLNEIAKELFDTFPSTFRFLFFTQETGLWLGASPELLLSYDSGSSSIFTMALAGSRAKSEDTNSDWDEKNKEEHRLVADFIASQISSAGLSPQISAPDTVTYGAVEHLHTAISAVNADSATASHLLDMLNPTPALGGYPRDAALQDINTFENHDRLCYGGYIAIHDKAGIKAYVNLRCAMMSFNPNGKLTYNIFSGGGITALSTPAEEWMETELKALPLRKILAGTEDIRPTTLDEACQDYIHDFQGNRKKRQ